MKIKLSIEHNAKILFIEKRIPDIQLKAASFPMDLIGHNLVDIVDKMMAKVKKHSQ